MKTVTFRDMTWPSDEFMKADSTSDAFNGIEFTNCVCQEVKHNAIRIYKNTYINNSKLGYLCFNRPEEELSFVSGLLQISVTGSIIDRIEAGIDTFLEVVAGSDDKKSYIDEIEICGRAVLNAVITTRVVVERCGIAYINPSTTIEKLDVRGTTIIGTDKIHVIILRAGGKVMFSQYPKTEYLIIGTEGREPFETADGYICG